MNLIEAKEHSACLMLNTTGIWIECYKEITVLASRLVHTNTRAKTTGYLFY